MLWTKIKIVLVGTLAVSAVGITGGLVMREMPGSAIATSQKSEAAPPPKDKPAANVAAPQPKEKTYAFEMREKPWSQVFEWLSDQTGVPVIASKPAGKFTFISPRGPDGQPRKYTMSQIIDIINEGLLAGPENQQYVLIRRQKSFVLIPASQEINASQAQLIPIQELDKHGQTEIVSIILPLKTLVAKDLAPEVKKMMGPFGKVVATPARNQLYLLDMVRNLKRIHQTVQNIEAEAAKKK